jgi:hypothetical protein
MSSENKEIKSVRDETSRLTMLATLWARVQYSKKYPALLMDPKVREFYNKMEWNHPEMEKIVNEFIVIGMAVQAKEFDLS